jgi:hypothetical protein
MPEQSWYQPSGYDSVQPDYIFLVPGLAGIHHVNNPGTIMLGAADRSWELEPHGDAQYIGSSVEAGGCQGGREYA